jgi:hypothetical protein
MENTMQRENAMPFIRFEVRPVEDRAASIKHGRFMTKDVDYILIVPLGSGGKEQIEQVYSEWLEQKQRETGRQEIRTGDSSVPMFASRFPDEWLDKIEKGYAAWKAGQEMPVDGTPLAQWAVLSPAQRQHFIGAGVQTVEQLANLPDGGLDAFGMGGFALRQRARDFLQINGGESNKTTAELEALRVENESLKKRLDGIMAKLEKMDVKAA